MTTNTTANTPACSGKENKNKIKFLFSHVVIGEEKRKMSKTIRNNNVRHNVMSEGNGMPITINNHTPKKEMWLEVGINSGTRIRKDVECWRDY